MCNWHSWSDVITLPVIAARANALILLSVQLTWFVDFQFHFKGISRTWKRKHFTEVNLRCTAEQTALLSDVAGHVDPCIILLSSSVI
jgi:hypothetical protein